MENKKALLYMLIINALYIGATLIIAHTLILSINEDIIKLCFSFDLTLI